MANAVDKVNGIAIASIEKVNGMTDANIQAFNSFEFTGYTYGGITWTTGTPETHRGGGAGTGTVSLFIYAGGWH